MEDLAMAGLETAEETQRAALGVTPALGRSSSTGQASNLGEHPPGP